MTSKKYDVQGPPGALLDLVDAAPEGVAEVQVAVRGYPGLLAGAVRRSERWPSCLEMLTPAQLRDGGSAVVKIVFDPMDVLLMFVQESVEASPILVGTGLGSLRS